MINRNADCQCLFHRHLCFAQLIQCETLAKAELHVVPLGWRVHYWPQEASSGSREKLLCFFLAVIRTALFATSLIKPSPHHDAIKATMLHSIHFAEVHIWDNVVASVTHRSKGLQRTS